MNDLISITPDGKNQPTMSSKEIAELTGKKHWHVMRDIRFMFDELNKDVNPFLDCAINSQNKNLAIFNLPKEECLILVSGYSIKLRAIYNRP